MIQLREYQTNTIEGVFEAWKDNTSTLIVLPTGTGKTTVFTAVISRRLPMRALILVHREELITQAYDRLKHQGGIESDIEMASMRADTTLFGRSPVVIATVQTLCSGERMFKFKPTDFGTVVVDEAHHATASTYRKVLDFFKLNPEIKILGVTATPDRSDEEALGQVFQSVAYDYEILDAIHDGWLVPVNQQMVHVEGLDFSAVKTTAGDLNGGELAELMEKEEILQGVAASSIEIIGNRRTLAFTSSVKHAEMLQEIFNRHRPGMADWICGKTPKQDRRERLANFKSGKTQVMVNCGVLTEGFDCPEVECIIQARPTKSRSLYGQIIGRGLRPLPGIVDGLADKDARKTVIAGSIKPTVLVIDFVGNAGRHRLMTSADILGGKVSDQAIDRVIAKAKKDGGAVRMDEALDTEQELIHDEIEEKKKQEAARKARLVAKSSYKLVSVNPFEIFGIEPDKVRGWDNGKTLSEKQSSILLKMGVDPKELPYSQAKQILNEQFRRWDKKLCTLKQADWLKKRGYETKDMSIKDASKIMDAWAKNGWKRPTQPIPLDSAHQQKPEPKTNYYNPEPKTQEAQKELSLMDDDIPF